MEGPRRGQSPPLPGSKAPTFLVAQVVRIELVRVAAAALRGRGVDHVVEVVQPVGLAVRGQERLGRSRLLPGGGVERPQPAVPRDRVDRVLARRRRGHDDRRRGQASRAQHVDPVRGILDEGAVELTLPDLAARRDVDAVEDVGDAGHDRHLAGSLRGQDVAGDEGGEEVVHLARRAVELHLPQELHAPDGVGAEQRLVALPRRALLVVPVGQPVRLGRALRAAVAVNPAAAITAAKIPATRPPTLRYDMGALIAGLGTRARGERLARLIIAPRRRRTGTGPSPPRSPRRPRPAGGP